MFFRIAVDCLYARRLTMLAAADVFVSRRPPVSCSLGKLSFLCSFPCSLFIVFWVFSDPFWYSLCGHVGPYSSFVLLCWS